MHPTRKHFALGFIAAALFSTMNPASSQTLARAEPQAAGLII